MTRKYLLFVSCDRKFAVAFEDIKSIIVADKLTPIPEFPYYFAGTCNYEGKAVPVIDARARFGFEQVSYTDRSCIIICFAEIGGKRSEIGIITDTISVMAEVEDEKIQPCGAVNREAYTRYLRGIFMENGEPCYIVNVGLMVNDSDAEQLEIRD